MKNIVGIMIHCKITESPMDCIRAGEVTKALEKMKNHKALGLSGVVTAMLQATGEITR